VVPLLSGCSLNQALASAWLAWPYRLDTSKDTPLAHLEAEAHMAQWLLAVQAQRHGECVGGDLVVVDLAAMAGLHTEGMTEDKRETVFSSEISTPGPRKHKQHLENLRRKDMLPRLRNDRATCLLRRLFRLGLRGFCFFSGCIRAPPQNVRQA
jgi:hypothetical protein